MSQFIQEFLAKKFAQEMSDNLAAKALTSEELAEKMETATGKPFPKGGFKAFTHEQIEKFVLADEPRPPSKCKICGQGGLQWVSYPQGVAASPPQGLNKWMLVEVVGGRFQRHLCEAAKKEFY